LPLASQRRVKNRGSVRTTKARSFPSPPLDGFGFGEKA
jgi:hypothetical protein